MGTDRNGRLREAVRRPKEQGAAKTRRPPRAQRLGRFPDRERPRERLVERGPSVLSDAELLALVIGSGTRERDAVTIADQVRRRIDAAADPPARVDDLATLDGIGPAQACRIVAALELGRRFAARPEEEPPGITSPADVFALARDIRRLRREHFMAFYLDARNRVTRSEIVSIGTLNASLVHPREVFGPALRDPAASVVLAHNHPSGDTTPSEDDVAITRRLVSAGDLLGIAVLDHVVVGARGFTSFRERRLL